MALAERMQQDESQRRRQSSRLHRGGTKLPKAKMSLCIHLTMPKTWEHSKALLGHKQKQVQIQGKGIVLLSGTNQPDKEQTQILSLSRIS